jgi:hypothetical protein
MVVGAITPATVISKVRGNSGLTCFLNMLMLRVYMSWHPELRGGPELAALSTVQTRSTLFDFFIILIQFDYTAGQQRSVWRLFISTGKYSC